MELTPIDDCVELTFAIGSYTACHKFHVLHDKYSMILGMDFLKPERATIKLGEGTVEFKNVTVPLVGPSTKACLTTAPREIYIGEGRVHTFEIYVKKRPTEGTYAFEPSHRFSEEYPELDFLPSVNDMSAYSDDTKTKLKPVYCTIANNTGYPIQIPKGTTLGLVTRLPHHAILTNDCEDSQHDDSSHYAQVSTASGQVNSDIKPVQYDLLDTDLSDAQKSQFNSLIANHRSAFAVDLSELGCTDHHFHTINTGNAKPCVSRFYRQSQPIKEEMNSQIDELLKFGIIEPSNSIWRSPVCMVKKKCGAYRFAIDYRRLNDVTEKISWPLPRVEDVWDQIGSAKAKYFSTLDLGSAFWQIPLHPDSKEKTSFVTPEAQYQFTKLPFGLCNAPIAFQQTMYYVV